MNLDDDFYYFQIKKNVNILIIWYWNSVTGKNNEQNFKWLCGLVIWKGFRHAVDEFISLMREISCVVSDLSTNLHTTCHTSFYHYVPKSTKSRKTFIFGGNLYLGCQDKAIYKRYTDKTPLAIALYDLYQFIICTLAITAVNSRDKGGRG